MNDGSDLSDPQWIYLSTRDRPTHAEYSVHDEIIDGNKLQKSGIQQIISAYLEWNGKDVTRKFGNIIRGN